ncbi:MAG TPA: hypothetical protein VFU25_08995, partial [Ornithinibacter sp.]|nr:hypothetical protein [Ornithinibacter sp.]
ANVACDGCTTGAEAYQLVVVGGGKAFDRRDLGELTRWADARAAQLTAGSTQRSATPPASEEELLAELEGQAAEALGGLRTLHVDVDTSAAPG